MPKRIQMTRQQPWRKDNPDAVIVDRRSDWGNRFVIGERYYTARGGHALVRDRAHAVELFRSSRDARRWDMAKLRGKDLACWCPLDQPCHADVLLEAANRPIQSVGCESKEADIQRFAK